MRISISASIQLAMAIATTSMLVGCGPTDTGPTAAQPPPAVSVAQVIVHPISDWDEFSGRLQAPESVELRPRVSGHIDRVLFRDGSLVKKGTVLFQIDPRPFQAEVDRLEAQLQQARAIQVRAASEAGRGNDCGRAMPSRLSWPMRARRRIRKPRLPLRRSVLSSRQHD